MTVSPPGGWRGRPWHIESSSIAEYGYDGLFRRVTESSGGATRHLVYSDQWQVLEEYAGSAATPDVRDVWSPVYVDALVLRQRDTNADGAMDERLWAVQDGNWNVVALADDSGNVVERFAYDAFGRATALTAGWTPRAGGASAYGWRVRWQGLRADLATGLYHARFREVSPTFGRPLQRDPIGFAAGDANVYRWEGNGPTQGLDPSGLMNDVPKAKQSLTKDEATQAVVDFQKSDFYQGFKNGLSHRKMPLPQIELSSAATVQMPGSILGITAPDGAKITIVYDKFKSVDSLRLTLAHELIHSWDAKTGIADPAVVGVEIAQIVRELRAYAFSGEFSDNDNPGRALFVQVVEDAVAWKDRSARQGALFLNVHPVVYVYHLWDRSLDPKSMWPAFKPWRKPSIMPPNQPNDSDTKDEVGEPRQEFIDEILKRAKGILPVVK